MRFRGPWARLRFAGVLLVTMALLQACGGSEETPLAYELIAAEFVANPENAVDPMAVPAADDTRTYFHVFRRPTEWATWWTRVRSEHHLQPIPDIDFSNSTIAVIYLGMRSNSCYVLTVKDVVERGGTIIVRYHESRPESDDICSPVAIYPVQLIKIEATGLPVEFVELF